MSRFSPQSIAKAIVPPVEIVSSPAASQAAAARSTASGSDTPQSVPSANSDSYSSRTGRPALFS